MILAFCEPVYARPMGTEHIREVGPEGFKYGGGIPRPALCGFNVIKGWDMNRSVTGATIAALSEPRAEGLKGWLCGECAREALALLAVAPSEGGP